MAMGFHPKFSLEINPKACATLSRVVGHTVEPMSDVALLTDFDRGSLPQIWWASPPCQPFAPSGRNLGARDDRNRWPQLIKALAKHRPEWLMTENVHGMLHKPHHAYKVYLFTALTFLFPCVSLFSLDAADYGVPQHRKRVFLVCGPHKAMPPLPSHSGATLEADKVSGLYWAQGAHGRRFSSEGRPRGRDGAFAHVTVREALGMTIEGQVIGGRTNPRGQDREFERSSAELTDRPSTTIAAQHGGGAGNAGPFVLEHSRGGRGRGQQSKSLDAPSLAVTTAGDLRLVTDISNPAWFHRSGPVDDPSRAIGTKGNANIDIGPVRRRLTAMECARLQSFPDDHPWEPGLTQTDLFVQVGNAVPPPLAAVVGSSIQSYLPRPSRASRVPFPWERS